MVHKIFTIGIAENGLVLIQHSMDDEDLFQSRIEPSCDTLLETLSYRLRQSYELYKEWCEYYYLNDAYEGDGFSQEQQIPSCLKNLKATPILQSEKEFEELKRLGKADGPKPKFEKTEGSKIFIKKRRK